MTDQDPSPWHIKNRWLILLLEQRQSVYKILSLSLVRRLDSALHIAVLIHVRLHDPVKIGFVDHSSSFGALGFLLEILAQEVEIEFAFFDFGARL